MSIINKPKVEKYYTNTPDSVEVSVYPDFKRLGINEIEINDLEILKFRSICCTLFNRDVEFKTEDFKNKVQRLVAKTYTQASGKRGCPRMWVEKIV